MKKETYLLTTIVLFLIVGALHLLRSIFSWNLTIENVSIPLWVSYLFVVLLSFLIYSASKIKK